MERLNEDTRFELFDLIAELVDDGVFVLMNVCTDWQAQVVRSPRLWRYITISDNTEDLEAKLHTQIVISQGLPLVVRVYFPLISLQMLKSVLQRTIANLIVVTSPSKQDRTETFNILREMIVDHPHPQIACVVWRDSDGDHPFVPNPVQKQLVDNASLDDMEKLGRFLQAHPTFLLPRLDFSASIINYRPSAGIFRRVRSRPRRLEIPIKEFSLCVHTLRDLMSLSIDCRLVVEPGRTVRDVISLPALQMLDINLDLWSSGSPLLMVPRLRWLTLHGTWPGVRDYITSSECPLQLETLTLHTYEDPVSGIGEHNLQDLRYHFHSTHDLILQLHCAEGEIASVSATFTSVVQQFTASVIRSTHLHIHVSIRHLNLLRGLDPAINIHTIQISRDSRSRQSRSRQTSKPSVSQLTCDTLILTDAPGDMSFDKLPRPRKLILSRTPFAICDVPHSWATSLAQIETEETPHSRSDDETLVSDAGDEYSKGLPPVPQPNPKILSLRYLKCEVPFLVAALTSHTQFPVLEGLYIQSYYDYLEVDRLLSLFSPAACPEGLEIQEMLPILHTLAFDWFPEWEHICSYLEHWVKKHGTTSTFTLKLPKRPARQVLSVIVQLLNGHRPNVPLPGELGYDDTVKVGCRACILAGWKLKGDCEARHGGVGGRGVFSITKNTYY